MHHGWILVGLVFATQFVSSGLGIYAFGVLLGPLAEDLGTTRAGISSVLVAMSVAGAAIGPLVGRAVLLIPIHWIMAVGALVMAFSFLWLSRADSLLQLQLGYGIGVAFGMGTLGGVPGAALIVNWFDERRALALGIAGIGISLSGVVMTPVVAIWVESFGWRGTFQIFSVIALATAPLVWWLATTHPRDRGLEPYRESIDPPDEPPAQGLLLSTLEILRQPNLWLVGIAGGISFMAATALIAHIVAFGTDAGYEPTEAAWLLSILAAAATLAKVLFGWIAGYTGERAAFGISIALQAVGLIGLAEFGDHYLALLGAASALGLGYGATAPLMNALLARVFGQLNFGPAMGLAGPILVVFQSLGAPILGTAYDVRGEYGLGLWLLAAAMLVAALAVSRVRISEPPSQPAAERP